MTPRGRRSMDTHTYACAQAMYRLKYIQYAAKSTYDYRGRNRQREPGHPNSYDVSAGNFNTCG